MTSEAAIGGATPDASAALQRTLRVLLLEDSALDAELTLRQLRAEGFEVDARVVDDEAGFAAALATPPQLILADFSLPAYNGLDALKLARALAPHVPFVFVSGAIGEEHAVDMVKQGATDYVLKQRLARLAVVVRRALAEAEERGARRDAERTLRELETHYRTLVENLHDFAVISFDGDGTVRAWSRGSERLFGHRAAGVLGEPGSVLFADRERAADLWRAELTRAVEQGSSADDHWMLREDGSRFFGSGVLSAMRDDDGRLIGFAKVVRDMTAARLAAEQLQAAKDEAEAANRAKDHFLAVLSHELRTPLSPILLAVRLLESKTRLPAELSGLLEMIRRNVLLEARLIDDLLDLTRIARGKLALERAPVTLQPVIEHVVQMCRSEIDGRQLKLEVHPAPVPVVVDADVARLQQILLNLLRNAIKFTGTGGRIALAVAIRDDMLRVTISDSGIGIAAEAIERIFSAFEQAGENITRSYGGLGLGLPIARALAREHGGELTARSDGEGCGATFALDLPMLPAATADSRHERPGAVPEGAPAGEAESAPRLHVLLVEDHADTRATMVRSIEAAGHRVTTACSVAEAMRSIASTRFDLLISDLGLPDGSGLSLARVFRATQSGHSVALTGFGRDEDLQRSIDAGFDEHLTKPVSFEQLSRVLSLPRVPR